jgi:hypothetical protein
VNTGCIGAACMGKPDAAVAATVARALAALAAALG